MTVDERGVKTAVITAIVSTLLLVCACGDGRGPVVTSSDAIPADVTPGDVTPGDVTPGDVTPGDVTQGLAASGCVVEDVHGASGDASAIHRVSRGESLSSIAREVYGDAALWREIARANPDLVGPGGSVKIGAVLVIPFAGR